jgi:YVTN family beta-propeller protein
MSIFARASAVVTAILLVFTARTGITTVLMHVKSVALAGDTSRFDYESIDPRRRLLFVAHLGNGSIEVVDLRTQRLRAVIPAVSEVHGVLAVPSLNRLYASATGSNELAVIDEGTVRVIARTPAGEYPDGIAYAAPERKLYVSDEAGGTETVIDALTNRRVATIPLGGEAGNSQFDDAANRIYVNVQTAQQLVAIDPRRDRIVGRYSLAYCKNNHGLLLNVRARVAYIACDENATLLTFDLRTHKITAKDSVGDAPDVLAYDQNRRRLYVAAESGMVAVFDVRSNGALSKLGMGYLAPNAHSVAVDPATGYTYFPIANADGKPVLEIYELRRTAAGP